ncbi:Hypothetical predicted protein [Scomber scombrus]|uniref:Uncharacterized protein n=1 Tax=Scomber scombrus TaxID=13677 RepID=A0AAV1Q3H6_SCOSC
MVLALPTANRTVTTEKLCIMQITGREQLSAVLIVGVSVHVTSVLDVTMKTITNICSPLLKCVCVQDGEQFNSSGSINGINSFNSINTINSGINSRVEGLAAAAAAAACVY